MTAGDVVLLNFPFSDLSGAKLRPAVVVAVVDRDEFVACMITSKRKSAGPSIERIDRSFKRGGLRIMSFARPGKLFTATAGPLSGVSGS
jgi:mRNA interferase MazF